MNKFNIALEAVPNSRPLFSISNHPNVLSYLTHHNASLASRSLHCRRLTWHKQHQIIYHNTNCFSSNSNTSGIVGLDNICKHFKSGLNSTIVLLILMWEHWVILKKDNVAPLCWKLRRDIELFHWHDSVFCVFKNCEWYWTYVTKVWILSVYNSEFSSFLMYLFHLLFVLHL